MARRPREDDELPKPSDTDAYKKAVAEALEAGGPLAEFLREPEEPWTEGEE